MSVSKRGYKSNQTTIHTIDIKHSEMLEHFEYIENVKIPELQKEKENLKTDVSNLKDSQLDEFMKIKDRIQEIQQEIKQLKLEKKQYFLNNSKHIFDYFEQKQQISNDSNIVNQNTKVLNSFFKIKATKDEASSINNDKYNLSRKSYVDYWANVNNEITNM